MTNQAKTPFMEEALFWILLDDVCPLCIRACVEEYLCSQHTKQITASYFVEFSGILKVKIQNIYGLLFYVWNKLKWCLT